MKQLEMPKHKRNKTDQLFRSLVLGKVSKKLTNTKQNKMEPTNPNANTYVNPLCIERDTAGQIIFLTLRYAVGHHALGTPPPRQHVLGPSPSSSVFVMKGLRFAFKSSTGVKVLADPHHERNNGIVPKSRKEALENDNRPHNTEKSTTAASDLL